MPLPRAIVDLSNYEEFPNHLIYGDTGAGKTPLVGTAPKSLMLALVSEQGTISAKRTGSTAKVWPIHHFTDAVEALKYLQNRDHPFEHVSVDSLSTLQAQMMTDLVDASYKANPAKRHSTIPAQDNYLEQQLKLKRWVAEMNALPLQVWYTALAMRVDDEEAEKLVLPLLKGKDYAISQEICAMMHTVSYLEVPDETKDTRRLWFARHGPYFGKDRLMVMGRYMDSPTVPKILTKIREGAARPSATPARRPGKRSPSARSN